MDYESNMREMLLHLAKNPSAQNASALVRACGFGISGTLSVIENKETVKEGLRLAFKAIWIDTMQLHDRVTGERLPSDDADFVRFMEQVLNGDCNG